MVSKRCCDSLGACSCKVVQGRLVNVTGTGTSQDPLIIASDMEVDVESNLVFQLTRYGEGSLESPYRIRVDFAPSASLGDIPDVDTTSRFPGYVLGWDDALGKFTLQPRSTAPTGAVSHGDGMTGDGSAANPLVFNIDPDRYLEVSAAGLGISDAGINLMLRVFADSTARDAASPAPTEGAVSLLLSEPSRLDYFDGTEWLPIAGSMDIDAGPELLALSGSYAGGPVVTYTRVLDFATDATGAFEVIPADDLVTYSGVLSVSVQPSGTTPAYQAKVMAGSGLISGIAYRLDGGAVYANATLQALVTAVLY